MFNVLMSRSVAANDKTFSLEYIEKIIQIGLTGFEKTNCKFPHGNVVPMLF